MVNFGEWPLAISTRGPSRRHSGLRFWTRSASALKGRTLALSVGDKVLHSTFGLGTVKATSGQGDNAKADVDFGSAGLKRLALRFAPLEKL